MISFSCDVLTGTLVVVRLIVRGRVRGYLYTHWGSAGMVSNHTDNITADIESNLVHQSLN